MVKRLLTLLLASGMAFTLTAPLRAQGEKTKADMPKKDRWEGTVVMVSKEKSQIKVRKIGSHDEKIIAYDANTKWGAQAHGSKKVDAIEPGQVGDGDRVICVGTTDKDGVLHATTISKRTTPQ